MTPLHIASFKSNYAMVELLLKHGAVPIRPFESLFHLLNFLKIDQI
jgi:ankyrin repeat protein